MLGSYKRKKERKRLEMDIAGKDEKILLGEVKWNKNTNAIKVLKDLKKKVKVIGIKKFIPIIIARGFKRKTEQAICLDTKDMEKCWRKNKN